MTWMRSEEDFSSVSLSLCSEVTASFAAATIAAVGTGVGLKKVIAKVTVQSSLLIQSDSF